MRSCAHFFGAFLIALACCITESRGQTPDRLLQENVFSIAYSRPDEIIAQETLHILNQAATHYSKHLPLGTEPVYVLLCHDFAQFKALAGRYGLAHVGGLSQPRESFILLKTPALLSPESDYGGIVRHELIHVIMARHVNEANTPRWFEEGVAMLLSGELRIESMLHLGSMYLQRRIIPYGDLTFAFAPAGDEESFGNAYAEALSLTQYLHRQTGDTAFWELVKALKTEPFDKALMRFTNMTPIELFECWNKSLWKVAVITSLVSGFTVFQFMAILVLIAYWRKRRKNRQVLQAWADEEALESGDDGALSGTWWDAEETGNGEDRDES